MNEQAFIDLRPFLYHLTDARNLANIQNTRVLLSTTRIIGASSIENKEEFITQKRPYHRAVNVNGLEYRIRDQKPLSILALSKCLTDGWSPADFIRHLNNRVFFGALKKGL